MKLVYLASPYSHPDPAIEDTRYAQVSDYVARHLVSNYFIYSPIAYWHPIARSFGLAGDAGTFKAINDLTMSKADEIWVYMIDGWNKSSGVKMEITYAKRNNKPLRYILAE